VGSCGTKSKQNYGHKKEKNASERISACLENPEKIKVVFAFSFFRRNRLG